MYMASMEFYIVYLVMLSSLKCGNRFLLELHKTNLEEVTVFIGNLVNPKAHMNNSFYETASIFLFPIYLGSR